MKKKTTNSTIVKLCRYSRCGIVPNMTRGLSNAPVTKMKLTHTDKTLSISIIALLRWKHNIKEIIPFMMIMDFSIKFKTW